METKAHLTQKGVFDVWSEIDYLSDAQKSESAQSPLDYEYMSAEDEDKFLDGRITELKDLLRNSVVVNDPASDRAPIAAIIGLALIIGSIGLYIFSIF
jgi:hypothetical protein